MATGRFAIGRTKTGGRTRGTQNRVTAEVRELTRSILSDANYLRSLIKRLRNGHLPGSMEVLLWHYAYGKPKETLSIAPTDIREPTDFDIDLSAMTPQELQNLGDIIYRVQTYRQR